MPAKLTLHPPRRAARFLVVQEGETLTVGRDPECQLVLEDGRVSRRHACLRWTGRGWGLEDLGSKNGTSVNGRPAAGAELRHGDWLSFGGLMGRFEALSPMQARALYEQRLARLETSLALRRRLTADLEPLDLLLRLLEGAIQVVGAERGFVLVKDAGGTLQAEVAAGFETADLEGDAFDGSAGAVARALESRQPWVVSDTHDEPGLRERPSVVRKGLGALVCVPLVDEQHVLGLLYVDSRRPAAAVSDLDVEILVSLAEQAALVLAGTQVRRRLEKLTRRPLGTGGAPVLEALTRRVGQLDDDGAAPADAHA